MIGMMIGRDLNQFYVRHTHVERESILEIRNLATFTYPAARASLSVPIHDIASNQLLKFF